MMDKVYNFIDAEIGHVNYDSLDHKKLEEFVKETTKRYFKS